MPKPARTKPPETLGARVRALRAERGLTLKELARRTGISISFLSLIETNKHDVSIGRLLRIAQAFEVDLRALVPGQPSARVVVNRSGRPPRIVSIPSEGIEMAVLLPQGRNAMVPLLTTIRPGGSWLEPSMHPGHEFVYVLAGRIECDVGGERFALAAGDSAYFDGMLPHRFSNAGKALARMLSVGNADYRAAAQGEPGVAPSRVIARAGRPASRRAARISGY